MLAIEGTLEMAGAGRYINRGSGTPLITQHRHDQARRGRARSSSTRRSRTTALIQGVELEGGGTGSTGTFDGVNLHAGTFELADGAALTNTVLDGGTRRT